MGTLRLQTLTFQNRGPYNLVVKPGQCICITGASGSGKSLLLRSIADLDPHEGEVYLDDLELNKCKPTDWRKQVGLLPAESRWWSEFVQDHFDAISDSVLQQLGFNRDVLGWEVRRLSTGERQRLAIARLLENQPKVLLLDEPTASLDNQNVVKVEELILNYSTNRQASVVWVSHDQDQVKRVADRHFILSETKLTEVET